MNILSILGRACLKDQEPITEEEWRRGLEIGRQMRRIAADRESVTKRRGLDPGIVLPAGNWGPDADNDIAAVFRFFAEPSYDGLNQLRLFTTVFTGYRLMSLARSEGNASIVRIPADLDAQLARDVPEPDSWVHRYLGLAKMIPIERLARAPWKLGEIGWNVDGHPVNHDVCVYQERLNLLHDAGILDTLIQRSERGVVRIVEIGGGYGGLGYFLTRIIPNSVYVIVDIAESLLVSSLYLALTTSGVRHHIHEQSPLDPAALDTPGFLFIPNHLMDDLAVAAPGGFDLAINTLSFSEMTVPQVRWYGERLAHLLGTRGVLFEQNQDNRHCGMIYAKDYLGESFRDRHTITLRTIRTLSEGVADIWSNATLSAASHEGLAT